MSVEFLVTVSLHFCSMTENFNLVTSRLTRVPLTIMPDSDAFLPPSRILDPYSRISNFVKISVFNKIRPNMNPIVEHDALPDLILVIKY